MFTDFQRAAVTANFAKATAVRREKCKARRIAKSCEHCGASFSVPPSSSTKRFCCRPCRYAAMRGANAPNSGGGDWMRGSGNPRWKGGVPTDERTRAQHQAELSQWRRRVFARDRYTCQHCGLSPKTRNTLRAHHIQHWATHPELRFKIDNGMTLCRNCHDQVHKQAA